MDLTKITTPFGLLDAETQAALKAHGGPVEQYVGCGETGWNPHYNHKISYHPCVVYRVKPQPLTKPSIDWSHVAPQFKWLARDMSGNAWIYDERPHASTADWMFDGLYCCRIDDRFASYTPGTCDWRDSLVQRPEGV